MNAWQVLRQIEYLAQNRNWTGGSTPVFGGVSVVTTPEPELLQNIRCPYLAIKLSDGTEDPLHDEEPGLTLQRIMCTILQTVSSGYTGRGSLIGANRTGGFTQSKGRGITEIQRELYEVIKVLHQDLGVKILGRAKGPADAVRDEKMGYISYRGYNWDLLISDEPFYHPIRFLTASDLGGGQARLSWTNPPQRFDRYQLVIRRAAGSTPPPDPTSGDPVYSGTFISFYDDTPGAGQFSYSVFVAYDETNKPGALAQADSYSAATSRTVTVS